MMTTGRRVAIRVVLAAVAFIGLVALVAPLGAAPGGNVDVSATSPTPVLAPSVTPSPVPTLTPTVTLAPTPAPIPTPTPMASPTPAPTPVKSATPRPKVSPGTRVVSFRAARD